MPPAISDEEYVVEKILSHRWDNAIGQLKFEVKWEGYEKKSDRTWEPEENLLETSVLDEYYANFGGKEKILQEVQTGLKNKKRGRPQSDTPTSSNKRSRKNGDHPGNTSPPATAKAVAWKPPAGSWEDQITELDACEDEESGKLMVYLTWKDGHKTQHETSVIYKRCPQKMLQFYERHVRIIKKDPDEAMDEAVM
ncbi:chromo domain-like protein [Coniochaeta ligniaria NRRL 30616]|uniref:Chromo domain-like protein n=1 Tax=Coniochaeta ligniaria NRRL 30616 TaxID=1408157 RepID=A0A1J7IV79_9PEZI|nr:chromo domain-like protein [Coniochaeta ligniaria NRRL 30616]